MSDSLITTGNDFARNLLSAVTNATLYGMEHPQVARLLAMTWQTITLLLEKDTDLSLKVIEGELVINNAPQPDSLSFSRLAALLASRGIGNLRLVRGVTAQDIATFVSELAGAGKETGSISSSEHVRVGRVEVHYAEGDGGETTETSSSPEISLKEMPARDLACFMEIYEAARQRKKLKITGITDVVSGFVEAFREGGKPLLTLATLREKDEYTFTHSANVSILVIAQAMSLGIEGELLNEVGVAAMLHDIGKIFIPEEILSKKDKLTDQEFAIMRDHPVMGARYLFETPGIPRIAVVSAFEHHLKFNRSGYPRVAVDWEINICSHLVMIADFFDALRTRRSYREPLEFNDISAMMLKMMGTDLHPVLTRNFLSVIARLV